jgi:D-lactate dehydrogenase (cytochrome)
VEFVKRVRSDPPRPAAVEFFDHDALRLLREQKKIRAAFSEIPDMPDGWHTAVYVEYHGEPAAVEGAVMVLSEAMAACGGDADATWIASDDGAIDRMKAFRHAVPEAVNLLIDERRRQEPNLTKLGTDLAVPDQNLEAVLAMYRRGLTDAGLESVVFGHIGNNHVHVNIIPATLADYERGRALYLGWAREVVAMGGTVSAEHGIGKLKTALLREMYGEQGIREMRRVKRLFDPQWILNVGNLFGAEPDARE